MFKLILCNLFLLTLLSALSSCQSNQSQPVASPSLPESPLQSTSMEIVAKTQCSDPRPQICTKEYRPVCAERDTEIRCVTTPCPSNEQVTKSNACTACADEKVISYIDGACQ